MDQMLFAITEDPFGFLQNHFVYAYIVLKVRKVAFIDTFIVNLLSSVHFSISTSNFRAAKNRFFAGNRCLTIVHVLGLIDFLIATYVQNMLSKPVLELVSFGFEFLASSLFEMEDLYLPSPGAMALRCLIIWSMDTFIPTSVRWVCLCWIIYITYEYVLNFRAKVVEDISVFTFLAVAFMYIMSLNLKLLTENHICSGVLLFISCLLVLAWMKIRHVLRARPGESWLNVLSTRYADF